MESSTVRVGTDPEPKRIPPLVALPESTMSKLDPMEAICSWMRALAPEPMAIMAMTAPTPMMMPSMVRPERILLRPRAL